MISRYQIGKGSTMFVSSKSARSKSSDIGRCSLAALRVVKDGLSLEQFLGKPPPNIILGVVRSNRSTLVAD